LAAAYWRYAKQYYVKHGRPTDELAGIKISLRRLKETHGRVSVDDFGPIALKAIRQRAIDAGNSRGYVNQSIGRIKRVFRWGVEQELISATTYQALAAVAGLRQGRTEARETDPVMPVEDAVVDATIQCVPQVIADMIRIQRLSGCRPEEICALTPGDIDRSVEAWAYNPESHKMEHHGRRRIIFFGPQAQALLAAYLSRDPEIHCFRSRRSPTGCFTTNSYRDAIHRACDQAFPPPKPLAKGDKETVKQWHQRLSDAQFQQLKAWQRKHRWNPNQLRHSAATEIRRLYGLMRAIAPQAVRPVRGFRIVHVRFLRVALYLPSVCPRAGW
jgi:integrase